MSPARLAFVWRVFFLHRQPAVARFEHPASLAEVWKRFHRDGVVGAEPMEDFRHG